jgi:hypothetical protein
MQLFDYLKGLFHRITKGQIRASCDAVTESLQKHTLPAYAQASELFHIKKLSSAQAKEMAAEFEKIVGKHGSHNLVEAISDILNRTVVLLGQIGEKSDVVFSEVESTLGMTFQKAMYLRLISAATFADDYARKLLNYLYVVETAHVDPQGSPLAGALTPAEQSWVEANYRNFCLTLAILEKDPREVMQQIDELPDALVTEHTEQALIGSVGKAKMDPLGFHGFSLPVSISVKWNPFYLIGTMLADFRVAQYKCAKEELELLQMRKLNLEKLYAKQPDARIQQQLEYMSDRVARLNFELQETEAKYA